MCSMSTALRFLQLLDDFDDVGRSDRLAFSNSARSRVLDRGRRRGPAYRPALAAGTTQFEKRSSRPDPLDDKTRAKQRLKIAPNRLHRSPGCGK